MRRALISLLAFCVPMATLMGCQKTNGDVGERVTLELWKHETAQNEREAIKAMIDRFNNSQDDYTVDALSIPQSTYTDALVVGALAGNMPCIMDVDNPMLANFVWAEFLQPLDNLLPTNTFERISSSAIGEIEGQIYAVGQFDAALALFTRRSTLEKIGARIPTLETPWTKSEFETVLAQIKATGDYSYSLDLNTRDNNPDWWIYAFLPLLQSFGGDIVDPENPSSVSDYYNSETSADWAEWFQGLIAKGYVNRKEPDDRGLQKGRTAMAYTGNWWVKDIAENLGDDLLILPPPDLGAGVVLGGGSWQWAISKGCAHPEGAAAFIEFITSDTEIAAIAEAAGMVPVTAEAAELTNQFRSGGDWRVFFDLSNAFARQRPKTPAFVSLKNAFTRSMQDIIDGENVKDALDDAVDDIDFVIQSNNGYRPVEDDAP